MDQTLIAVAVIAAVPPTIVATAGLMASLNNADRINQVHLSINSRMDQLVAASKAQGRQDERDSQK
jgi:hypothetical protein